MHVVREPPGSFDAYQLSVIITQSSTVTKERNSTGLYEIQSLVESAALNKKQTMWATKTNNRSKLLLLLPQNSWSARLPINVARFMEDPSLNFSPIVLP